MPAHGNDHFILLRTLSGLANFRQKTVALRAVVCGEVDAVGARKETGLSLVCMSDSTSSIIWRSSFSLISIFHPLAKFVGIECARDVFNLFPAFALQAITCCRTGIIVDVIHRREHLPVADDNGGGMQIVSG
ncbi:Uncharacterised protein [Citrobacter koseri]|uniref:Uncharacterized protein n=1 Tax=Citrobacter koseri TaxID=545 RepID=A0A2X2W024_CITKO|nr:Uncharacterised protein [Citrobacter koseri]